MATWTEDAARMTVLDTVKKFQKSGALLEPAIDQATELLDDLERQFRIKFNLDYDVLRKKTAEQLADFVWLRVKP